MADVVGPTRRSLAPAANTSPRPPLHEVRFDNTEGAASRKAVTSSSDTMRQSANRHKTYKPRPPRRSGGLVSPMTTRDTGTRQPTTEVGTVGRVAPRPAAATQKVASMTSVQGKPTAVTPSAPVGTDQLVRSHPSCVASFRGRGGGVFPRNPSPT